MAKSAYTKVADNIYRMTDKVNGKKRKQPYRVHIHYKDKNYVKHWPDLEQAKIDRDNQWRFLRMPKEHQQIAKLSEETPVQLILRYIEEVSKPKGRDNEEDFLRKLSLHMWFISTSLYDFDSEKAESFVQAWLKETTLDKAGKRVNLSLRLPSKDR
jgi:hypothetical protein